MEILIGSLSNDNTPIDHPAVANDNTNKTSIFIWIHFREDCIG